MSDDGFDDPMKEDGAGYGRPPRRHQFKPGVSGNPRGRPKGSKNLSTLIKTELNRPLTVAQDGKKLKIKRKAALVKGLVNDALQGKDRPREKILDFIDRIEAADTSIASQPDNPEDEAIIERFLERRGPGRDR